MTAIEREWYGPVADVLVGVQVDLDLANMDFSDFADSAGPGGVYRGFD